ncbi:hypothetical protein ALC56_00173, partial [Trachymyrmex septentrionalis]
SRSCPRSKRVACRDYCSFMALRQDSATRFSLIDRFSFNGEAQPSDYKHDSLALIVLPPHEQPLITPSCSPPPPRSKLRPLLTQSETPAGDDSQPAVPYDRCGAVRSGASGRPLATRTKLKPLTPAA